MSGLHRAILGEKKTDKFVEMKITLTIFIIKICIKPITWKIFEINMID